MEVEKKLVKIGGTYYFSITKDMLRHLDIHDEETIMWKDDNGKYGNFISFWKKPSKNSATNNNTVE